MSVPQPGADATYELQLDALYAAATDVETEGWQQAVAAFVAQFDEPHEVAQGTARCRGEQAPLARSAATPSDATDAIVHLRRATEIRRRVLASRVRIDASEQLLDGFGCALLLVDHRCHVTFANAEAKRLLEDASTLCTPRDRLRLGDARLQARLDEFVDRIGKPPPAPPLVSRIAVAAVCKPLVALALDIGERAEHSDDVPLAAVIVGGLGVPDGTRPAGNEREQAAHTADKGDRSTATPRGTAADAGRGAFDPSIGLREAFGLSDRQASVVAEVAAGCTLADAAVRLSLTPATARTHYERALAKLGVSTQVALAAQVASSPVRQFRHLWARADADTR